MTETVKSKAASWLQKLNKPDTPSSLRKTITMLNAATVIFGVTDILLIARDGFTTLAVAGFALLVYFMSFKNQCELKLIKLQLENEIDLLTKGAA